MSDMTVTSSVYTPASTYTSAKSELAASKPARKIDVIDLSKPPTPKQAEWLRNHGILGYGTVSAKKTVATTTYPDGSSRTVTSVEYKNEFFSAVDETTYQFGLSGSWVSTENGFTVESAANLRKVSWYDDSFYACSVSTTMSGCSSWCIPPHRNEDGSWSLAEFGPSAKVTISGYHSVLIAARSSGGQTQVSWLEAAVKRTAVTISSKERPAGVIDCSDWFLQSISKKVLEQLNQQAALAVRYLNAKR